MRLPFRKDRWFLYPILVIVVILLVRELNHLFIHSASAETLPIAYGTACEPPANPVFTYQNMRPLGGQGTITKGAKCRVSALYSADTERSKRPRICMVNSARGNVIKAKVEIPTPCAPGSQNCWKQVEAHFCKVD